MKGKVGWIMAAVLLAACCGIFVLCSRPVESGLGRDRDKAFLNGSGITLEELDPAEEENLYKLAKVWGFVKYYHPDIIAGEINWDAELFRVMPRVVAAENSQAANQVLYDWLSAFPYEESSAAATGETAAFWREMERQYSSVAADLSWISDRAVWGRDLCAYLEGLSRLEVTDRRNGYAAFAGESPLERVSLAAEKGMSFKIDDDGVKLLAVFRLWNAFTYYSPYLSLVEGDWDDALRQGIHTMLGAEDQRAYELALGEMMAGTGDVHVLFTGRNVAMNYYFGEYYLPCHCMVLDGRPVVDAVPPEEEILQPGDVITAVDGVTMTDRIAALEKVQPVPTPGKYGLWFCYSLVSAAGPTAQVTVERDGVPLTLTVPTREERYGPENPWESGLLEDGRIGYIDPGTLQEGDVERLMEEFADTEGIIVDLRQYPSVDALYLLGEYCIPEPRPLAAFDYPDPLRPGSFCRPPIYKTAGAGISKIAGLSDREDYPLYEGKVVLLINEFTQSRGETTAMGLRQAPRAVVVGSPSIGADGDVVEMNLPGRLLVYFSGLGVYTPEGETIQRVGVQPDIFCRPTAEALRQGRDVLLEEAVRQILDPQP